MSAGRLGIPPFSGAGEATLQRLCVPRRPKRRGQGAAIEVLASLPPVVAEENRNAFASKLITAIGLVEAAYRPVENADTPYPRLCVARRLLRISKQTMKQSELMVGAFTQHYLLSLYCKNIATMPSPKS